MSGIPLLRLPDRAAPFARRDGRDITVAQFLRDVASLAALLPEHRHVANLCRDRYRFAVGFAASLCRRQITLLPPSEIPALIEATLKAYDDVYCLTDTPQTASVPVFAFPTLPASGEQSAPVPHFAADQPAAILFTSGSTGLPQPHVRDWGLLVSSAISAGRELGVDRLPGASLIGTVPHQHSYGLESLILLAWQHDVVLHAERPFYPGDICDRLAAAPRPRILITTPAHLRVLVAEPGEKPGVDLIVSATAPLPNALAAAAETAFAAPVHEIFGCSEVGQLAARRTLRTEEWTCLDGIALRQEGTDTWAGGPAIPVETRLADIMELRDPHHFRLIGRTADLINIAGKRSSLAHLNAQINAIAGVRDAVFVMGDETGSGPARLVAFAVAPGLTAAAILAALRHRIDPAFLPRKLHLVSEVRRNDLGKLTRETVTQMLAEAGGR
jgi:acyl-coenzyme A synthetase/AMP-(fatty) acid ligase